jgi:hypothetical protein
MKKLIFLALLCIPISAVYSQGFMKTHVAKLSLSSLALRNVALNYEYAYNESHSLSLHGGFIIPSSLPSGLGIEETKIGGFFLMPELRKYKSFKQAPGGFYISPYLRFNHFKYDFLAQDFANNDDVSVSTTVNNIGAAFQMGYQFIFSDKITLDLYFFGIGLFYNWVNSTFIPGSSSNVNAVEQEIEEFTVDIPYIGKRIETSVNDDNVTVKAPFLSPGIRIGFSLGIMFYQFD